MPSPMLDEHVAGPEGGRGDLLLVNAGAGSEAAGRSVDRADGVQAGREDVADHRGAAKTVRTQAADGPAGAIPVDGGCVREGVAGDGGDGVSAVVAARVPTRDGVGAGNDALDRNRLANQRGGQVGDVGDGHGGRAAARLRDARDAHRLDRVRRHAECGHAAAIERHWRADRQCVVVELHAAGRGSGGGHRGGEADGRADGGVGSARGDRGRGPLRHLQGGTGRGRVEVGVAGVDGIYGRVAGLLNWVV